MQTGAPIAVGIIGLGRLGYETIIPQLLARPNMFRIVAGCEPEKDRRENFARLLPNAHAYRYLEDMMDDALVEVFIVATRTDIHGKQVLDLVKHGKHVIVEPPLCLSVEEAIVLRAEAIKSKSKVIVNHVGRLSAAFALVEHLVKKSELSDIYQIEINAGRYVRTDDWTAVMRCGGGALNIQGLRLVNMGLTLLQSVPTTIFGDVRRVAAAGDAEDCFTIFLRNFSQRTVQLSYNGGRVNPRPLFVVSAANGEATIDSLDAPVAKLRYFPTKGLPRKRASIRLPKLMAETEPEVLPWIEKEITIDHSVSDLDRSWNAIYQALNRNAAYPVTFEQIIEALKIITRIRKDSAFSS